MKIKKLILAILISIVPVMGRADASLQAQLAAEWAGYIATLGPITTTAHEYGHALVWDWLLPGSVKSVKVWPHICFLDGKRYAAAGFVDRNFDVLERYQQSNPLGYKIKYSLGFLAGTAVGYLTTMLLRKIVRHEKFPKKIQSVLDNILTLNLYIELSNLLPISERTDGEEIVKLWAGDSLAAKALVTALVGLAISKVQT